MAMLYKPVQTQKAPSGLIMDNDEEQIKKKKLTIKNNCNIKKQNKKQKTTKKDFWIEKQEQE